MSSNSMARSSLPLMLAAAVLLGVALVASPLTVCAIIAAPLCLVRCGRGLPDDERRWLIALLSAALIFRVAVVAAQVLRGLPLLNDMSVGALAGDEAYYLSRALRVRDVMLGYAATHYDYFVVNDDYGQTSYLTVLTWLQIIFGPTPYSVKLLNGLSFVCGAAVLFRVARSAFGPLPSFTGLVVLLFIPSLLFSSVSLLKESSYFLISALAVACAWRTAGGLAARQWRSVGLSLAALLIVLFILDGLRRGGFVLIGGGLLMGAAIWFVAQSRRRTIAAAVALAAVILATIYVPAVNQRFLQSVESVAKIHAGHVFTIGHVYKLLDDGFYVTPQAAPGWQLELDNGQAWRFLVRAAVSFVVTPWPWEMRSFGELALLPEHLAWLIIIAMLPFGIRQGWRANPIATALFMGIALPTAAAVAVTNGNIGTLFRLRGLVTPYLLWIGALGLCAAGEWLASRGTERQPLVLAEGQAQ